MQKSYLKLSALLGALSVLLGAFGAHELKKVTTADVLATFHTGVSYQMFHAIALMGVGMLYKRYANSWILWAGRLFVFGVILFSGSLYLLVFLKASKGDGLGDLGFITPIGGLALIAGWICLFIGIPRKSYS